MIAPHLALLMVGAGVAVHLEEVRDLTPPETTRLLELVADAVQRRTAMPVHSTRDLAIKCPAAQRCDDAIRAVTSADQVLFVRAIGVPGRVRLITDLTRDGSDPRQVRVDLPRDPETWAAQVGPLLASLFPERDPPSIPRAAASDPADQLVLNVVTTDEIVPWTIIGASVVAAAIGVVLGVNGQYAKGHAEDPNVSPSQADRFSAQFRAQTISSWVLYGLATAGAATGVVMLSTD